MPLFKDSNAPRVELVIDHNYSVNKDGETFAPSIILHRENGEDRIIVTEDAYEQLAKTCSENDHIPLQEAREQISDMYITDELCLLTWGLNPLEVSKELWKRWQAIKFIVTPNPTS